MFSKVCYEDIDFSSRETHQMNGIDFMNTYHMKNSDKMVCVYLDTLDAELCGGENNDYFCDAELEGRIIAEIRNEIGW